ncbi:DUF6527 family protein [Chitinophaga filiformis]|uniref:DUF6527 family protein n=1 Tax=Chitinophaga filiformis TaxID=104663 RepID=UPI00397DC211
MTCPCGCGKILYLNLLRDYAPYWAYKTEGKIISLSPSVHRTVGCKSHFFITDGKLIWCR